MENVTRVVAKLPHGFLVNNLWVNKVEIRPLNGYDVEYIGENSGLSITLRTTGLLARVASFGAVKEPELSVAIEDLVLENRITLVLNLWAISLGDTLEIEPKCPVCREILHVSLSILSLLEPRSQADLILKLGCPSCSHNFEFPFNVEVCFFEEINKHRSKFEKELNCIASTYHWSEDRILSLSLPKRKKYFDIINRNRCNEKT